MHYRAVRLPARNSLHVPQRGGAGEPRLTRFSMVASSAMRPAVLLALATCLAALPSLGTACSRPDPQNQVPTSCSKVGQQCSLPPGKLGSCVSPIGCTTADCLVCQSQH